MKNSRQSEGFSLVELLFVIMIIGILAGIAFPLLARTLPAKYLKGDARSFYSAILHAKSEAVMRGEPVSIRFYPAGDGPNKAAYLVFLDNGKGTGGVLGDGQQNGAEERLLIGKPLHNQLKYITAGTTLPGNALTFDKRGLPRGAGQVPLKYDRNAPDDPSKNSMIQICLNTVSGSPPVRSGDCRAVAVSPAGRVVMIP